jgi:hypothetical protein
MKQSKSELNETSTTKRLLFVTKDGAWRLLGAGAVWSRLPGPPGGHDLEVLTTTDLTAVLMINKKCTYY